MERKIHRLASLFPLVLDKEYERLRDDIKENGLRQPIVTYKDEVLDGQRRKQACKELGIEPETTEYTGDDPLGFVISANVHRRQLNESQRAMIAAGLANMRRGTRTDLEPPANLPEVSQERAAEMMQVSPRSLRNAKTIREKGTPEQIESVQNGSKTISKVLKEINPPKKTGNSTSPTATTVETNNDVCESDSPTETTPEPVDDKVEAVCEQVAMTYTGNEFLDRFKEALQGLQTDDQKRVQFFLLLLRIMIHDGFSDSKFMTEFVQAAIETIKKYLPTQDNSTDISF